MYTRQVVKNFLLWKVYSDQLQTTTDANDLPKLKPAGSGSLKEKPAGSGSLKDKVN
jgi:hypothetical protein